MTIDDITHEIKAMLYRAKFVAQFEERDACADLLEKAADAYDDPIGEALRKAAKAIRERPVHA